MVKEEMDVYGYTKLGVVNKDIVDFLHSDLVSRKEEEISTYGRDLLKKNGYIDLIRGSIRFHPTWVTFLEANWLNEFVDCVLNDVAVIHDCFCLFNTDGFNNNLTRNKFHRDQPWFKDTRTSVTVFVLLQDTYTENGPTELVPSTHLFKNMPREDFLEKHKVQLVGPAGQVYAMDSTLWHRAGINSTGNIRPLLSLRYQLAFMNRPIDLCKVYQKELENASDLLKTRFGWFSRSMDTVEESFLSPGDKWHTGQYKIDNSSSF